MENHIEHMPQVTNEKNNILLVPFTEKEIKDVVFQMELNKPLGPVVF